MRAPILLPPRRNGAAQCFPHHPAVYAQLLRHAQISTTMNVYGNALMTAKREANSKVVRMALRSA